MFETSALTRPNTAERAPARRQALPASVRPERWRGFALRSIVAAITVAFSALLAACGGASTPTVSSRPAPRLFSWTESATTTTQTPQAAYAAAMRLTPCLPGAAWYAGDPPRSSTVTWLLSAPDYGLANIQVTCAPPAQPFHLFLLQLYRDAATGGWRPTGTSIVGKNANTPGATVHDPGYGPPPAWLPLPDDAYVRYILQQPGYQQSPEGSIVDWDGQANLFVLGHIADRAVQPMDATPLNREGGAAWMTSENGLVTVTQILADGTTRFFAGTAAPTQAQALAAAAFAHSDDVLQPLPTP